MEDPIAERVKPYLEMLESPLRELRNSLLSIINQGEDISRIQEAIKELDAAREVINSAENIGIIVTVSTFMIAPFELTGDPKKDLGQKRTDLPNH